MQYWGWVSISLLEVNKDKDKEEFKSKQDGLEERIKKLGFQDPFEEDFEEPLNEPEDEKILYYLLIVFILVGVNIVSILLITLYLRTPYKFIYQ